jgi:hypothetical protein
MERPKINYVAVVVTAFIQFALGAVWYSPMLFGNKWMQLTGITMEMPSKMSPWKTYGLTFIAYVALAYVLVHALAYAKARSAQEGAVVGFWNWFGFVATVMGITNRYQMQPWMLWGIDSGYQLVNFILGGIILTAWHKKLWEKAETA